MPTTTKPTAKAVGELARQLLGKLQDSAEFGRLKYSSFMYVDCWATFTGYPVICEWDMNKDKGPLFKEAIRVLALKAAVFELSGGDEKLAELLVSPPVDEMVHAVLAQATLCSAISSKTGLVFVHMTDQEEFGYNPGDYTWQCYLAAFGEKPPERYWLDAETVKSRLHELNQRYGSAGIQGLGRSHDITFGEPAAA